MNANISEVSLLFKIKPKTLSHYVCHLRVTISAQHVLLIKDYQHLFGVLHVKLFFQ